MNISSIIFDKAKTDTLSKTAIIFEDRETSYKEILDQTKNLVGAFANLGMKKGEKVALFVPTCPEYLISYFAAVTTGAVAVPINTHFKGEEVKFILEDSGATTLILGSSLYPNIQQIAPKLSDLRIIEIGGKHLVHSWNYKDLVSQTVGRVEVVEMKPDDDAHIIYTTGTTGKPKGVLITHSNLSWMAKMVAQEWEMRPDEKIVLPVPLFHVYGLVCSLSMMISGSINLLVERFRPDEMIELIMKHKPASFMGVPTMYTMMLDCVGENGRDMSFLKYCASGAASLPVEVLQGFRDRFKTNIVEGYGLSECTVSVCKNPVRGKQKPGSIGLPFPGLTVKIFDEHDNELPANEVGEIVVRGPNVMKGYLNNPEATQETMRGGWLHTGDLGYKDEEGYFYITDRKKDMYIRGGENVYPREMEEVLYGHSAVLECAVIGVPDTIFGQVGKAFIVLRPGHQLSEEEVIEYCKNRLAYYKVPKYVELIKEFPKTATGKILKRELKPKDGGGR